MRMIAVANQKGGVGKTTTAINLAASIARRGRRVILVDLDPQANATSGLGLPREFEGPTTYELLLGQARAEEALRDTGTPGLTVVPATPHLAGAELELGEMIDRDRRLRLSLRALPESFDFVFIDCPPSLGLLTLNALVAADSVLVPLQCEYYALEGLSHLLETIRLVKDRLNPDLTLEGIVLTMYDGRLNLSMQVAEDARRHFGDRVYHTMIPRNVRLGEAPGFGKPITDYDPACVGAASYIQLAAEVIGHE